MKKILIVEDDPFIRDLTTVKLAEKNYEIFTAIDSESAVTQMNEHAPDIILLDLDLQDTQGEETIKRVHSSLPNTKTKIIIFSNNSDEGLKQSALDNGADAFFIKAETNYDDIVRFIEEA